MDDVLQNLVEYKGKKTPEPAFAKMVLEHWKAAKSPLSELHKLMEIMDSYYNADYWDKHRASWRVQPVTNYIYKMVTQIKAQVNKTDIAPMLSGENTLDTDGRIKKFEEVIKYVSDNSDLDDLKGDLIEAGVLLTTGIVKVVWNNQEYGGSSDKGNAWIGKVKYSEVDPTNFYPDPKAFTVQDCRYIVVAVPKTIEYLKERWPKFAEQIKPDSLGADVKVYTRPDSDSNNDEALLFEYWWKDKGAINCAYVAGDIVLEVLYNVYDDGKYPFARFTPKRKRKSFWGMSMPKQIKGNQETLNKLIEMIVVNAMKTANQQKLYDAQRIDGSNITNEPGLLIPVNNNDGKDLSSAYRPVDTPGMPPYVQQIIDMLKGDIKDVSGTYEAATGDTPGQVTAATAIAMLAEQASIPIEDIIKELFKTYEEIYELTASRIVQFGQEERLMMIKDPETGKEKPDTFRGSDFKDIDYKITIQAIKATAMTKAYVSEQASQLLDRQIITPEEYMEAIDFPMKDKIIQRLRDQQQTSPEMLQALQQQMQTQQPPEQGGFSMSQPTMG